MSYNTRSSVQRESNIKPSTVGGTTGATKQAEGWSKPSVNEAIQQNDSLGESREGKKFQQDSVNDLNEKSHYREQAGQKIETQDDGNLNRQDKFFNHNEQTAGKNTFAGQNDFDCTELNKEFTIEDE